MAKSFPTTHIIRIGIGCILLFFSGCIPTGFLAEDEYIVYSQKIDGNDELSGLELDPQLYTKTTDKLFGLLPVMPKLWFYKYGKNRFDSSKYLNKLKVLEQKYEPEIAETQAKYDSIQSNPFKYYSSYDAYQHDSTVLINRIRRLRRVYNRKREKFDKRLEAGNWWMRVPGKAPVIYDPAEAESSVKRLERYMFSKGYFKSEAYFTVDTLSKKRIKIKYTVEEGRPYKVKKVKYLSQDSALMDVVATSLPESTIEEGENYNEAAIDAERIRLAFQMKSAGYYDFAVNEIIYEVDSTIGDNQVLINVVIDTPSTGAKHVKYSIEDVVLETGTGFFQAVKPDTTVYNELTLIERSRDYNNSVLARKVHINPGELYDVRKVERTRRALTNTQMFKFVNVDFQKTDSATLAADIKTSNLPKYTYTAEAGITVTQTTPGPSVSLSLLNRNALGLMDLFSMNVRFLSEGQIEVDSLSNDNRLSEELSRELNVNAGFTFPFIVFPKSRRWQKRFDYLLPVTQTQLGYNYINRLQYIRSNFTGLLKYKLQMPSGWIYGFAPLDITISRTDSLNPGYRQDLIRLAEQGNTLINSFNSSIVTSTHLDAVNASSGYGQIDKNYNYLHAYAEFALPYLDVTDIGDTTNQGSFRGLDYFKYVKGSVDFRNGFSLGGKRQLATRAFVGLATPYGKKPDGLPYEKYFFSGGSSSNRAFTPRRVGPGSVTRAIELDTTFFGLPVVVDRILEGPGEISLELNAEYRAPLFGFFNWAAFVDLSNVWTWDEQYLETRGDLVDGNRIEGEGSKFELSDFYREFAVSTGLGLRMDFTFIIVRLDFGIKTLDPAQPKGERFVLDNAFSDFPRSLFGTTYKFNDQEYDIDGLGRLNIGIGYPF